MKSYTDTHKQINELSNRIRINRHSARHVGTKLANAGKAFLESIHVEIESAKPQWQRDEETAALNEGVEPVDSAIVRPELTEAYLRSLGIEP